MRRVQNFADAAATLPFKPSPLVPRPSREARRRVWAARKADPAPGPRRVRFAVRAAPLTNPRAPNSAGAAARRWAAPRSRGRRRARLKLSAPVAGPVIRQGRDSAGAAAALCRERSVRTASGSDRDLPRAFDKTETLMLGALQVAFLIRSLPLAVLTLQRFPLSDLHLLV